MQKYKFGHLRHVTHKVNSKQIEHPNVRVKTVQILKENIGINLLHHLGFDYGYLDIIPKTQVKKRKKKIRKPYFTK